MTSPLETINWLATQFRDRANDDPDVHTTMDAQRVEELRECFYVLIAALRTDLAMVTELKSALSITESADHLRIVRAQQREREIQALISRSTTGVSAENSPTSAKTS